MGKCKCGKSEAVTLASTKTKKFAVICAVCRNELTDEEHRGRWANPHRGDTLTMQDGQK